MNVPTTNKLILIIILLVSISKQSSTHDEYKTEESELYKYVTDISKLPYPDSDSFYISKEGINLNMLITATKIYQCHNELIIQFKTALSNLAILLQKVYTNYPSTQSDFLLEFKNEYEKLTFSTSSEEMNYLYELTESYFKILKQQMTFNCNCSKDEFQTKKLLIILTLKNLKDATLESSENKKEINNLFTEMFTNIEKYEAFFDSKDENNSTQNSENNVEKIFAEIKEKIVSIDENVKEKENLENKQPNDIASFVIDCFKQLNTEKSKINNLKKEYEKINLDEIYSLEKLINEIENKIELLIGQEEDSYLLCDEFYKIILLNLKESVNEIDINKQSFYSDKQEEVKIYSNLCSIRDNLKAEKLIINNLLKLFKNNEDCVIQLNILHSNLKYILLQNSKFLNTVSEFVDHLKNKESSIFAILCKRFKKRRDQSKYKKRIISNNLQFVLNNFEFSKLVFESELDASDTEKKKFFTLFNDFMRSFNMYLDEEAINAVKCEFMIELYLKLTKKVLIYTEKNEISNLIFFNATNNIYNLNICKFNKDEMEKRIDAFRKYDFEIENRISFIIKLPNKNKFDYISQNKSEAFRKLKGILTGLKK